MDIAKFFQNIDKDILMKILERKIKDKDIIWLTKEIIYSNKDNLRSMVNEICCKKRRFV